MLRHSVHTKVLAAVFVVMTFASAPLSALGQKSSPVAPARAQVEAVVREAYEKFKNDTGGKNADYIPYLAKVDSKLFGIAIVTTDNQVLTMGDIKYSFSIQSISKVFSQALAMEEFGPAKVFEKVGNEPTGRAFNSVFAVADMPTHTGNPYVNAGAIATISLITAKTADEKWNKILNFYSRAAGEKLTLIDEVYQSEAATNTGNKALSMLLAKYDRIYADPFESVAHIGVGRIIRPVKEQAAIVEDIVKDPQLRNVHFDISWDEVAKYVVATPESTKSAAAVVNRYPDRFLFGTDEVAPPNQEKYLRVYNQYEPFWRLLSSEASEKVRKKNYERIFDEARLKVRSWEAAHIK